ncbi:MAG: RNA polymerase sigma factor [Candidatus Woesebacteria bacterium]
MVFSNEAALIVALKSGESSMVSRWYEESKRALLAFFVHQVSNEADAQELVHDTYMSCLASLPLFRGESGLWSFMISIARHELADYWRKKYAKKAIAMLPFGQELLDTVERPQGSEPQTQEVQELLQNLPGDIAELLALKYIDGLSVKELAKKYKLSFAAMQSKLYRAKEVFKEQYERNPIS